MRRILFHIFVFIASYGIGYVGVELLSSNIQPLTDLREVAVDQIDQRTSDVTPASDDSSEYKEALEDIWIENDETQLGGYSIKRKCEADEIGLCTLTVKYHGKVVVKHENEPGKRDWLRYGFFNFLGKNDKQLVVHTYSGGAHCCYDYYVYDLTPRFRPIYESSKFDSVMGIGNQLIPVDIDGDGIYEFYQDVMAFDYMGFAGHASATFPPAIFAYDKRKNKFALANKKFSNFVLELMNKNLDKLDGWQKDHNARSQGDGPAYKITDDEVREVAVREKFLYLVYAGKREEAWKYFKANYRTESGDKYQDEFRDDFLTDFARAFHLDPTYRSIYGH